MYAPCARDDPHDGSLFMSTGIVKPLNAIRKDEWFLHDKHAVSKGMALRFWPFDLPEKAEVLERVTQ